jgi:hypothetical protein
MAVHRLHPSPAAPDRAALAVAVAQLAGLMPHGRADDLALETWPDLTAEDLADPWQAAGTGAQAAAFRKRAGQASGGKV